MTVFALIGAKALYLLFAWLGSAATALRKSVRKREAAMYWPLGISLTLLRSISWRRSSRVSRSRGRLGFSSPRTASLYSSRANSSMSVRVFSGARSNRAEA